MCQSEESFRSSTVKTEERAQSFIGLVIGYSTTIIFQMQTKWQPLWQGSEASVDVPKTVTS